MSTEQKQSEEELAADRFVKGLRGGVPDLEEIAAEWVRSNYNSYDKLEAVAENGPSKKDLAILRLALRKIKVSDPRGTEQKTLAELADLIREIADADWVS
jgi:hypothetical protein